MNQMLHQAHAAAALTALALAALAFAQSDAEIIGYLDMEERLGPLTPDGAGVVVGQVEANTERTGSYAPFPGESEFVGKTFLLQSGPSVASGHANFVGFSYYGLSSSVAPAIDTIYNWEANHWATAGYLHTGVAITPVCR
jgi:hypothetical protein